MRDALDRAADLLRRGRSLAIFVMLCTLITSFTHQALKGDHGLERRAQIKQRIAEMEAERARLLEKRTRLERDVALLRDAEHQPSDLAEEQARALLNVARPDDIIILDAPHRSE